MGSSRLGLFTTDQDVRIGALIQAGLSPEHGLDWQPDLLGAVMEAATQYSTALLMDQTWLKPSGSCAQIWRPEMKVMTGNMPSLCA